MINANNDNREFWIAVYSGLMAIVKAIKRYKIDRQGGAQIQE